MDYSDILVHTDGPVGVITLNSPATVNALSKRMIGEIISALQDFEANQSLKAVIIKGAGKHFCAGHNLSEMTDAGLVEYQFIFDQCTDMMNLLHRIPQPVIAQVHGIATAAGCQLVAACDLAICDESARFATPGVKLGLFCTTPMVALSRCVGRKRALEMLLTGRMISAEEGERFGLVNRVVPAAELETAVMEMAQEIAQASRLVLGVGKRAYYTQIAQDEVRAYDFAKVTIAANTTTEDAQEGIKSFLEKRKPVWRDR